MRVNDQIVFRQQRSCGDSSPEIHRAALAAAEPRAGLSWLDIGCGTGDLIRLVLRSFRPRHLAGGDVIDWLEVDLPRQVELVLGPAETVLAEPRRLADRVLLVETLEHLDAPWSVLRAAAQCVAPGGRIVVTTPNIASL